MDLQTYLTYKEKTLRKNIIHALGQILDPPAHKQDPGKDLLDRYRERHQDLSHMVKRLEEIEAERKEIERTNGKNIKIESESSQ